ncbi:MAG: DUF885 domain-containing protein [Cyclobacteriaceae bacterium]|nr:DUF885 domain-containing protein [Cyclobacteriaceae bacterium]
MKYKFIFIIAFFSLTTSCKKSRDSSHPKITDLADGYIESYFKYHPEWGTFFGYEHTDHGNLFDNSETGIKNYEMVEDSIYHLLQDIEIEKLSIAEETTYAILKEKLESSINSRACQKHLWSINQMNGFQVELNYFANAQPVGDSAKRQKTIERWKKISEFIENDLNNNKKGLEIGYALPKVVVERVIEQLSSIITSPTTSSFFYIPAAKDTASYFQRELKAIIEGEIVPSIEKYKFFLETVYLPKARENLSITSIPNGESCYAALLRENTSLTISAQEVFESGNRVLEEKESIIKEIGKDVYGVSDLAEIKQLYKADSSNYFSSKQELLSFVTDAIKRAEEKSKQYFLQLPVANIQIEPIPEAEEKSGYSRYLPAPDGSSEPARFLLQTYLPSQQMKGIAEKVAFHEAIPGHHLQFGLSIEMETAHPISKYFYNSGFSEGWATYAETLSDEANLYSSDKNRLAMYIASNVVGMILDVGIHHKNWSREEAVEYIMSKRASYSLLDAQRLVDRVAVIPGQATSYGVGEICFQQLKEKSKERLGENFNIKSFHNECLQYGSVPLSFIVNKVNDWIANNQ